MENTVKKQRQSNIELLRIIAMLLVIGHHLAYRGGLVFDTSSIGLNRLIVQFMMYGGHVGVAVFAIISGYFMIEHSGLKIDRIIRVWLQMFFYSISGCLIGTYFFNMKYEIHPIISVVPFIGQIWGFASAYLALCIIAPFLNILLRSLSKSQYRLYMIITCGMWLGFPTFTNRLAEGNYFIVLVVIYSIGAYIKLFYEDFNHSLRWYVIANICIAGACYLFTVVIDIIGLRNESFLPLATHFSGINHLNIVIWAAALFLLFVKIDIRTNKVINYIAGLTFGVYLLHDCYYYRTLLWDKWIRLPGYANSPMLIGIIIIVVAAIFGVCALIEALRKVLIEKWVMILVHKITDKLQRKIDAMMKEH